MLTGPIRPADKLHKPWDHVNIRQQFSVKVGGQWIYLYRAVDKQGKTVESYLSRTRDVTAAKAFFE